MSLPEEGAGGSGTSPASPSGHAKAPGARSRGVAWILVIPLIGTLIPEIYNRTNPAIGGMPFFYWYQLAWIPVSVACTALVFARTRR